MLLTIITTSVIYAVIFSNKGLPMHQKFYIANYKNDIAKINDIA